MGPVLRPNSVCFPKKISFLFFSFFAKLFQTRVSSLNSFLRGLNGFLFGGDHRPPCAEFKAGGGGLAPFLSNFEFAAVTFPNNPPTAAARGKKETHSAGMQINPQFSFGKWGEARLCFRAPLSFLFLSGVGGLLMWKRGGGELKKEKKKKKKRQFGIFLRLFPYNVQPVSDISSRVDRSAFVSTTHMCMGFFFSTKKKPTGQHMFPRIFSPSEVLDKNQGSESG